MEIGTGSVLLRAWTEPHRIYHSLGNHLLPLLEKIDGAPFSAGDRLTLAEVAWWHDAIYVLGADDNERRSIELYRTTVQNPSPRVIAAIEATELHQPTGDALIDWFLVADLGALATGVLEDLLKDEQLVFEEFTQHYSLEEYTTGRIRFLTAMLSNPLTTSDHGAIKALMRHAEQRLASRPGPA